MSQKTKITLKTSSGQPVSRINHITHRKLKKSATLMRVVVERPSPTLKRQVKVLTRLDLPAISLPTFSQPLRSHRRSQTNTPRSPSIKHFDTTVTTFTVTEPTPRVSFRPNQPQPVNPSVKTTRLDYMLTKAMEQATAHELPPHKVSTKLHRRLSVIVMPLRAKKAA